MTSDTIGAASCANGNGQGTTGGLLRTRYYPRQLVTAADLTADQDYVRERLRQRNRLLHGCGVICGLLVHAEDDAEGKQQLTVGAGSAIDGLGNEIVVPQDVSFAAEDLCWVS